MALPMAVKRMRFVCNVNDIFCRCEHRLKANGLSKVSTFTFRHLPYQPRILYSSQDKRSVHDPTSNQQQATPSKPGLFKRVMYKSDYIFCALLGRISPWMLQEYGQFKIGFVKFTGDFKSVYIINKKMRKEKLQLKDLHWKELHLKKQISNDMAKMTPTMLLLCLPIVYYFVLPLMFIYPTVFLANQFLSHDKLLQYQLKSYKQRVDLYPIILELLLQKLVNIKTSTDRHFLQTAIDKLQSEQQVTVKQVLQSKNAFQTLCLNKLSRNHLKCLCRLCSLRTMFMPGFLLRRKLNKNIALIQAMDYSIRKEGISTLDHLELEKLCYERGLNTVHSDKNDLEIWLRQWVEFSSRTNDDDQSLIAHSVAFLVMGHPSCHQLQDINRTPKPAEKTG